ncbi:hypothetical protein AX16_007876 [Volvariella volvacea WC 439]|nr:hypothetical protein AX16_007876 [Volvariella volvacea WC 439]
MKLIDITSTALLCLGAFTGVNAYGNVVFFYTSNCSGTAVGCWNIPVGLCCSATGQDVFGSGKAENGDIYLDVWSHRSCSGVRSGGALAGNCHSPGYAISSGMSFTVDHDNDRKRAAIRGREAAAEEAECQQVDTVVFEDENGERVVAKIPAAQMEEVLAAARENNIGRLQQLERVDTA